MEIRLIASQLCSVNQSLLFIEVPTIQPHLQTSGGRAKQGHPGAVAQAMNQIEISKQHHRSTDLETEDRERQTAAIHGRHHLLGDLLVAGIVARADCR